MQTISLISLFNDVRTLKRGITFSEHLCSRIEFKKLRDVSDALYANSFFTVSGCTRFWTMENAGCDMKNEL